MEILRIYTDGACSGNQSDENVGGWGAVLEYGPHKKELFGGEVNTTNNRMELTAVIEALKALKSPGQTIQIFTDSSYVANCFRENGTSHGNRTAGETQQKSLSKTRNFGRNSSHLSVSTTRGFSA